MWLCGLLLAHVSNVTDIVIILTCSPREYYRLTTYRKYYIQKLKYLAFCLTYLYFTIISNIYTKKCEMCVPFAWFRHMYNYLHLVSFFTSVVQQGMVFLKTVFQAQSHITQLTLIPGQYPGFFLTSLCVTADVTAPLGITFSSPSVPFTKVMKWCLVRRWGLSSAEWGTWGCSGCPVHAQQLPHQLDNECLVRLVLQSQHDAECGYCGWSCRGDERVTSGTTSYSL